MPFGDNYATATLSLGRGVTLRRCALLPVHTGPIDNVHLIVDVVSVSAAPGTPSRKVPICRPLFHGTHWVASVRQEHDGGVLPCGVLHFHHRARVAACC